MQSPGSHKLALKSDGGNMPPRQRAPRSKKRLDEFSPKTLFGQFLLQELQHRNVYITDFAKVIGVTHSTLHRFFTTDDQPRMEVLLRVSEGLDISFVRLVMMVYPDYAGLLVRQQNRAEVSEAEERLLESGILPIETTDRFLGATNEKQLVELSNSISVVEAISNTLMRSRSDELQDRLLPVLKRHTQRIRRIL